MIIIVRDEVSSSSSSSMVSVLFFLWMATLAQFLIRGSLRASGLATLRSVTRLWFRGWHGKIFGTHPHSIPTILFPSPLHPNHHRSHPHPVPTNTVPIHTILSPTSFLPVCLYSVIIFVFPPIPNHFFCFCILFFFTYHFVWCFFVMRQGYCNKNICSSELP